MTTLYFGSRTARAPHVGLCLTDWDVVAAQYGEIVVEVEVDLSGLVVREVEGYDRDENTAIGDRPEELAALAAEGVDVIIYDDEDERGRAHQTWRLISERAVELVAAAMGGAS